MDDLQYAVDDIFDQSKAFEFDTNTMAILFVRDETDYDSILQLLRTRWSFPIIGSSALGLFTGDLGYRRDGIAVMLMTADDCSFAVGMTKALDSSDYADAIRRLYSDLKSSLPQDEEEKLILCYSDSIPGVNGDMIISAIESSAPHIPIYGGMASDTFSFTASRVFCNDRADSSVVAMALISGNIHPIYSRITSVTGKTRFSYEVTKSTGDHVYELEGIPFADVLRKAGLEADKSDVVADYILSPFVSTISKGTTTVEVLRDLNVLDLSDGSGIFLGGIEEGSSLEIGLLNSNAIHDSVRDGFLKLLEQGSKDGIRRNTILCTSCSARYLAIGGGVDFIGRNFWDELPDDREMIGMYSYGEYCPIDTRDADCVNLFHNSTFTMIML